MNENRIPVGILGATGMVGQHFVKFLQNHPWFEIAWLGASDRSAGKPYARPPVGDWMAQCPRACGISKWKSANPAVLHAWSSPRWTPRWPLKSSASLRKAGHVIVSNSRNHRMEPDVPLLIPEVNPDHLKIIPHQQRKRGWKGQIATNPNCSTIVLAMSLAPLKQFGITRVVATTMQAISGAGYPGVASMDINANVIPFIGGEEEKMQQETQKILGDFTGEGLRPLNARVSAHCNRVPVVDGHTVTVSVEFERKPIQGRYHPGSRRITAAFRKSASFRARRRNPSSIWRRADRPQPRRDVERERGMAVFVGRLRECPVLDYKFIALGHNTIRGAAGAAVLNAELMYSEGLLD